MKKLITMALAIMVMMASSMTLVACGESKAAVQNENVTSVTTAASAQSTASTATNVEKTGKIDEKYLPSGDYTIPDGAQMVTSSSDESPSTGAKAFMGKYVDLKGNLLGVWITLEYEGQEYIYGKDEQENFANEWKNITGYDTIISFDDPMYNS